MTKEKIVIIEDEPDIVEVITYNLRREGYQVTSSLRGDDGLKLILEQLPDLIILDLMLPGMDGHSICQNLKSDPVTKDIAIIMVTAKAEDTDIVIGLGLGADDYLAKPFSPRELLARVKAVLRRGAVKDSSQEDLIKINQLTISPTRHEVRIEGELVAFTATEFKLLFQLAKHPGRVYSREQLLNRVVGDKAIVLDRNIDVHIRSLRKKLLSYGELIQTVRGVGYRMTEA